jgi:hypothetical protein
MVPKQCAPTDESLIASSALEVLFRVCPGSNQGVSKQVTPTQIFLNESLPTIHHHSFHSNRQRDIKDHEWFKKIDFRKLVRKTIQASWVLRIKDPFDLSHFDYFQDAEKEKRPKRHLSIFEISNDRGCHHLPETQRLE